MSDLFFGTDLFSEFDRMQRQMASLFGGFPSSIRSGRFGAFPPVNIAATDDSIEIVAFVPGLKPDQFEVSIDKGLLILSGEREAAQAADDPEVRVCARAIHRRVPACGRITAERRPGNRREAGSPARPS